MAGCDTQNITGDHYRGMKEVLTRFGIGGALLGASGSGLAGALAAIGITLGVTGTIPLAIIGAIGGYFIGVSVGFAIHWFTRLKSQNPDTIEVQGMIVCAGKNSGLGIQPFNDNDWTFNMLVPFTFLTPLGVGVDMNEVLDRPAPDSGMIQAGRVVDPDNGGVPVFHCEISSYMGSFGAVGLAVGGTAGAIAGVIVGAAICAALGIATLGLGFLLCILIVIVATAIGAAVGGAIGSAIGSGLGWIADQIADLDGKGKAISSDCVVFLRGKWVSDTSHEHNEIHDIEASTIIECGVGKASSGLTLAGAVGTGRHPSDRDP
ncbi:MAG TPA: hypothetical protein VNI20_11970 [Fimbriimonadaceae bacterium]|nr:hypothetical protein [Fimbriimonadaceae bacterium]